MWHSATDEVTALPTAAIAPSDRRAGDDRQVGPYPHIVFSDQSETVRPRWLIGDEEDLFDSMSGVDVGT